MGEEVNSPKTDEQEDLSHLFTCDKNPSHIVDDLDIPKYSSKFQVLKHKDGKEEVEQKPKRPSGITCWNCGGKHNLRDCTEPRNHAAIARGRAESQAKFVKAVRYHADEEQKHPHLQPGKISDRLREAMGLRPDQVPPFVYRMRELGYPPGWVEEAKVSHSGLSMFDSNGQEIKDPDLEDGEIVAQVDRDKYDFRKLIEYPGFNVPFEPGTTDETDILGARPMRESQSIQYMQQLWSGKRTGSYKRKRLRMQPATQSNNGSPSFSTSNIPPEEEDMELDADQEEVKFLPPVDNCGFVPPLPESSPNRPPPPPTPPSNPKENLTPPPPQGVKRKLSVTDEEDTPPKVENESNEEVSEKSEESEELDKSTATSGKSESTENKAAEFASPAEKYNGRVKLVSSGTPVITRSEFKHLPSPENFSKDICDVINFENLPNSTGKYEQMHSLIKKVRNYVTQSLLKSDEEDDDED